MNQKFLPLLFFFLLLGGIFPAQSVFATPNIPASVYTGGGFENGVNAVDPAALGISQETDIRSVITNILTTAVSYLALAALIVIVIAGFMLILGLGSDDSRQKAQNILLYTLVGIIIVFLASGIVLFFLELGGAT